MDHKAHHTTKNLECLAVGDPVTLVNDIGKFADGRFHLVIPDENPMASEILNYPCLFGAKKMNLAHHERDCECFSSDFSLLSGQFLPSICIRKGLVKHSYFSIDTLETIFTYNNSKVYQAKRADNNMRTLKLLVPKPFLNNFNWEDKHYVPFLANRGQTAKVKIMYGLIDQRSISGTISKYVNSPKYWAQDSTPYIRSIDPESELSHLSEDLYHPETLLRTQYGCHPAHLGYVQSMSGVGSDLIIDEVQAPNAYEFEEYLLHQRSTFILRGEGAINCPSCLPSMGEGKTLKFKRFSRIKYINHYRANHLNDVCFIGIQFPTNLNHRLLEGLYLYLMTLTALHCTPNKELECNEVRVEPYSEFASSMGIENKKRQASGSSSNMDNNGPKPPREGGKKERKKMSSQEKDLPPERPKPFVPMPGTNETMGDMSLLSPASVATLPPGDDLESFLREN